MSNFDIYWDAFNQLFRATTDSKFRFEHNADYSAGRVVAKNGSVGFVILNGEFHFTEKDCNKIRAILKLRTKQQQQLIYS